MLLADCWNAWSWLAWIPSACWAAQASTPTWSIRSGAAPGRCRRARQRSRPRKAQLVVYDFARCWKRRPWHPLRVPHHTARSEQRRIVEATACEVRSRSGVPEQRRTALRAKVPCVLCDGTIDPAGAERTRRFSDLVIGEVDGPAERRTCAAAAIVAVTKTTANGIALDLHRTASASGYAHVGCSRRLIGLRSQPELR